jgi:hypothetical protein
MITNMSLLTCDEQLTHAHVQGAVSSRLRATAVLLAPVFGGVPATGLPITDVKRYRGQGSRAWSPPV